MLCLLRYIANGESDVSRLDKWRRNNKQFPVILPLEHDILAIFAASVARESRLPQADVVILDFPGALG